MTMSQIINTSHPEKKFWTLYILKFYASDIFIRLVKITISVWKWVRLPEYQMTTCLETKHRRHYTLLLLHSTASFSERSSYLIGICFMWVIFLFFLIIVVCYHDMIGLFYLVIFLTFFYGFRASTMLQSFMQQQEHWVGVESISGNLRISYFSSTLLCTKISSI